MPLAAGLTSAVSYLDQTAVEAARPGAREPASIAGLEALLDAGDLPTQLWWAAMQGVSSGDPDLLQRLPSAAEWPERVGFDVLDVEAQLTFGTPPSDGTVLLGSFDPEAVAAAFAERGYESRAVRDRLELCGPDGREEGMAVNAAADSSLPFGGQLGRHEPLFVGANDILSSADLATLIAMRDAAEGVGASLAEEPAWRALASVLDGADPPVTLIQTTFLPGGMLGLGPDIYRLFSDSPEAASELLLELDAAFEPMPAADAIAILDAATADEQRVSIALAYADEADAAVAAEVLPRRLAALPTLSGDPLAELLAEREASVVSSRVVPAGPGTTAAAVIELAARLPPPTSRTSRGDWSPRAASTACSWSSSPAAICSGWPRCCPWSDGGGRIALDLGVVRVDQEAPARAVHGHAGAGSQAEHGWAKTDHQRQLEGPGDDGRVPGHRAFGQRQRGHAVGAQRGSVGRPEVRGDDDRQGAIGVPQLRGRSARQSRCDTTADVQHVSGAGLQVGIGQRP